MRMQATQENKRKEEEEKSPDKQKRQFEFVIGSIIVRGELYMAQIIELCHMRQKVPANNQNESNTKTQPNILLTRI